MRYIAIYFISLIISFSSYANEWNRHYNLVNSDLKTIQKIKSKDLSLSIRYFELLGEKLTLLQQKESEYRIEFLEKGSKKNLNTLLKQQKATFKELDQVSRKILLKSKDRKVLSKIYYYKSLNYYMFKNYRQFYINIKKAERINKDKKLAREIAIKLADYYYNEKKYSRAIKYYRLIINSNDKWKTKYLYNYSWCLLKVSKNKDALVMINKTKELELSDKYFKIGPQLNDGIMLFYAINNQVNQGINAINKYKINTFDNWMKYLHYTFENGKKKNAFVIIRYLETQKFNPSEKLQIFSKKILVLRTLKQFKFLNQEIIKNSRNFRKQSVTQEALTEFINTLTSYTGFLQELIKSKGYISKKKKNVFGSYVRNNFELLSKYDEKNKEKYNFFIGESYFALKQYDKALNVYIKAMKIKKKTALTDKVFEAAFKSLEYSKNDKKTLYVYKQYLRLMPKTKKYKNVYTRYLFLLDNYIKPYAFLARLNLYYKIYGQDKVVTSLYKKNINKLIDKEKTKELISISNLVAKRFLGYNISEKNRLLKIVQQIKFFKLDNMAKKGQVAQASNGFLKIARDVKNNKTLRIDAYKKAFLYLNRTRDKKKLVNSIIKITDKSIERSLKKDIDFYRNRVCLSTELELCYKLSKKYIKWLSKKEHFQFFKLSQIFEKKQSKHISLNSDVRNKNKRLYLFKSEVYSSLSETKRDVFSKYRDTSKVLKAIEERRIYQSLFNNGYNKTLSNIKHNSKLKREFLRYSKLSNDLKIIIVQPPSNPNSDLKFKTFEKYLNLFTQKFQKSIMQVDNAIKKAPIVHVPFILKNVIQNYTKDLKLFSQYVPISKDKDLEKAITDELFKIRNVLQTKKLEYENLFNRSLKSIPSEYGAMRYYNDLNMNEPNIKIINKGLL